MYKRPYELFGVPQVSTLEQAISHKSVTHYYNYHDGDDELCAKTLLRLEDRSEEELMIDEHYISSYSRSGVVDIRRKNNKQVRILSDFILTLDSDKLLDYLKGVDNGLGRLLSNEQRELADDMRTGSALRFLMTQTPKDAVIYRINTNMINTSEKLASKSQLRKMTLRAPGEPLESERCLMRAVLKQLDIIKKYKHIMETTVMSNFSIVPKSLVRIKPAIQELITEREKEDMITEKIGTTEGKDSRALKHMIVKKLSLDNYYNNYRHYSLKMNVLSNVELNKDPFIIYLRSSMCESCEMSGELLEIQQEHGLDYDDYMRSLSYYHTRRIMTDVKDVGRAANGEAASYLDLTNLINFMTINLSADKHKALKCKMTQKLITFIQSNDTVPVIVRPSKLVYIKQDVFNVPSSGMTIYNIVKEDMDGNQLFRDVVFYKNIKGSYHYEHDLSSYSGIGFNNTRSDHYNIEEIDPEFLLVKVVNYWSHSFLTYDSSRKYGSFLMCLCYSGAPKTQEVRLECRLNEVKATELDMANIYELLKSYLIEAESLYVRPEEKEDKPNRYVEIDDEEVLLYDEYESDESVDQLITNVFNMIRSEEPDPVIGNQEAEDDSDDDISYSESLASTIVPKVKSWTRPRNDLRASVIMLDYKLKSVYKTDGDKTAVGYMLEDIKKLDYFEQFWCLSSLKNAGLSLLR